MLLHPTLDLLNTLGLTGMAKGLQDLDGQPEARSLDHSEWLGLLLEREVTERRRAEAALRDSNAELERRVAERTADLTRLTEELQAQIAERLRIEEGLKETSELLQATFNAAPFPISVTTPDTRVLIVC